MASVNCGIRFLNYTGQPDNSIFLQPTFTTPSMASFIANFGPFAFLASGPKYAASGRSHHLATNPKFILLRVIRYNFLKRIIISLLIICKYPFIFSGDHSYSYYFFWFCFNRNSPVTTDRNLFLFFFIHIRKPGLMNPRKYSYLSF